MPVFSSAISFSSKTVISVEISTAYFSFERTFRNIVKLRVLSTFLEVVIARTQAVLFASLITSHN